MATTQQQDEGHHGRVMRVYTRALRVPVLIGKVPGGGSIPLGPYTLSQLIGGASTLIVGGFTLDSWGPLGASGNITLLLLAAIAVTAALGRIKTGSRNPAVAAIAAATSITGPTWGRLAGRPVRARRPTRVTHRLLLDLPTAPAEATTVTWPSTTEMTVSTAAEVSTTPLRPARRGRARTAAAGAIAAMTRARTARAPEPAPRLRVVALSSVGQLLAAATASPVSASTTTSAPAHRHLTRSSR